MVSGRFPPDSSHRTVPTIKAFLYEVYYYAKKKNIGFTEKYSGKELSFKVICEKLPTLFSRDGGIYTLNAVLVTNQIAGMISVNDFNYLPNQ